MFFELFADTGAKDRGPELGPSLTNVGSPIWRTREFFHSKFNRLVPKTQHLRMNKSVNPSEAALGANSPSRSVSHAPG